MQDALNILSVNAKFEAIGGRNETPLSCLEDTDPNRDTINSFTIAFWVRGIPEAQYTAAISRLRAHWISGGWKISHENYIPGDLTVERDGFTLAVLDNKQGGLSMTGGTPCVTTPKP